MGKYNLKSLEKINGRFNSDHILRQSDVDKANAYVELIERTRSTTEPKAGDVLRLTDKYGCYYPYAHIEDNWFGGGNVCEHASVPFIGAREDGSGIYAQASGGAWQTVEAKEMRYVGKIMKRFCDWGNCGACGNGAIEFAALVSLWEYTDPNADAEYNERNYEKFFLSDSGEDSEYTKRTGYRYHVSKDAMNYTAFRAKEDLDAWVKTYRAKVIDRGDNSAFVWAYKRMDRHCSPSEFDAIRQPEDTMVMNGAVRRCKRIYDDVKHTVTNCFVWYWSEAAGFYIRAERQNKIRDSIYTLPWNTPEYILARREA